jgi:hypothetical protein
MVRTNHALALVRCARAARLWSTKHTEQAGSELKAAARCIEDAASWLRAESRSRLCAAAAEVSAAGEKLQNGAAWTREEIDNAFLVLRDAVDAVGTHIGSAHKAAPSDPA